MKAEYKKVGERIRSLRKQKGLTQEDLAALTKIEARSIVDIEAGKRNPTLKTLTKIANALNLSSSKLLE